MIIPTSWQTAGGERVFNRSAGLQVFNPAPAMECKGAQMVKAALARRSGVLPLIIFRSSFALLQSAGTWFEISLQAASRRFICNRDIRAKNCRQVLAGRNDPALLMRCKSTPKIVRGTDVDVAVAELKTNVRQAATVSLRSCRSFGETSFALSVSGWPVTRNPTGRRVAEPEGFEPSIGLYNPITV